MKNKCMPSKDEKRLPGFRLLLIISMIWLSSLSAQSISSYENKFVELRNVYGKESGILDSLKNVLNEKIKEIDYAKKRNEDENNIRKLMGGTVTISNRIDDHQKKLNLAEKEFEQIKKILNKKYAVEIDSLSLLVNSDLNDVNKNDLKSRILTLTEKKILTAPKINSLSFNPEKILAINISAIITPEAKGIYSEYLTGALNEVNNQLSQVRKLSDEVKQIVTLQQKSKKFIEESEFDYNMNAANITSRIDNSAATNTPTYVGRDKVSIQSFQVQSFFVLLKQLDLKQTNELYTRSRFSSENPNKRISLKDYRELLKEVEKRLADYRLILTHKINSAK
jgi:hypothetical protein